MNITLLKNRRFIVKPVSALIMFFVALAGLPVMATATPVFVNENLNDLNIKVESSLVGRKGMAFIENNEQQAVLCNVIFKNGPELPVKRRETINPGVKKVFEASMSRVIVKLVIDVECSKQ